MDELEICEVIKQWLQEGVDLFDEHGDTVHISQLTYRSLRGYIQLLGWSMRSVVKASEPKWKILAVENLNVEHPQQPGAGEVR